MKARPCEDRLAQRAEVVAAFLGIFGSSEVGVMPGRVFTSSTYSFSPSVASTRPGGAAHVERRGRTLCHRQQRPL